MDEAENRKDLDHIEEEYNIFDAGIDGGDYECDEVLDSEILM